MHPTEVYSVAFMNPSNQARLQAVSSGDAIEIRPSPEIRLNLRLELHELCPGGEGSASPPMHR